jgi:hypothetical protein
VARRQRIGTCAAAACTREFIEVVDKQRDSKRRCSTLAGCATAGRRRWVGSVAARHRGACTTRWWSEAFPCQAYYTLETLIPMLSVCAPDLASEYLRLAAGRGSVVPGLLGTRLRERSRVVAHEGSPRRRRLGDQRAQDLDVASHRLAAMRHARSHRHAGVATPWAVDDPRRS